MLRTEIDGRGGARLLDPLKSAFQAMQRCRSAPTRRRRRLASGLSEPKKRHAVPGEFFDTVHGFA